MKYVAGSTLCLETAAPGRASPSWGERRALWAAWLHVPVGFVQDGKTGTSVCQRSFRRSLNENTQLDGF